MDLEIVSHCWRYWRTLTYQASGLYLEPPGENRVTLTVCYCPEDNGTRTRLEQLLDLTWPPTVTLRPWPLPRNKLFRRCIGRNLAARATEADVVWFADCDHVASGTSIDDMIKAVTVEGHRFAHPHQVLQMDKEPGDRIIADGTDWRGPLALDRSLLYPKRIARATGGVQIVEGDLCRELGYLHENRRWQRPKEHLGSHTDDVAFRKSLNHRLGVIAQRIDVRDFCRIRHSVAGRADAMAEN